METKKITTALRGLAILSVILGHYAQYFATNHYDDWFRGYAYGIVGVFFVLAGYGSFFSLKRRLDIKERKFKQVLIYWGQRALRIYPLYWFALIITPLYLHEYFLIYKVDIYSFGIFLGLPFVNSPGIFWFVPAILQCYLLAPLFYFLLNKMKLLILIAQEGCHPEEWNDEGSRL